MDAGCESSLIDYGPGLSALGPEELQSLLHDVRSARLSVDDAARRLSSWPTHDLGHTRLDLQREARCGHPEVVFGAGKSAEQIHDIAEALLDRHSWMMVTRIEAEAARHVCARIPDACHHPEARMLVVDRRGERDLVGNVLVVSAGTSDAAVAEEARLTAGLLGARTALLPDVGVAGLHRVLAEIDALRSARVLIVVAGMEGALASVVGGLVDRPIIAVPTSTGYGASWGGLAALLAMLNSCVAGVTVVNIDNGFGAGSAAARINRLISEVGA